jgi:hypothetical protein
MSNPYLARLRALNQKNGYPEHCQNCQNPEQKLQGLDNAPIAIGFVSFDSGQGTPFSKNLAALRQRCPDYVDTDSWSAAITDAGAFLLTWGTQAAALGWTAQDLFRLHEPPARPHPSYSRLSRYDCIGLVWMLRGCPVVAMTTTSAAIRSPTGSILTYRKRQFSPAAAAAQREEYENGNGLQELLRGVPEVRRQ